MPKFVKKPPQVDKTTEEKTEVIKYKQSYVPKESKPGECWTISSTATSNDKAWRCMSGDFIYDPCFETETNQIVCNVDPELPESGFELKLTKPLPERGGYDKEEAKKWSWIVKLQNGLICEAISGTAGTADGENFYYACNRENIVILGYLDKGGPLWKAKAAYISENEDKDALFTLKILKSEELNIIKVWE